MITVEQIIQEKVNKILEDLKGVTVEELLEELNRIKQLRNKSNDRTN